MSRATGYTVADILGQLARFNAAIVWLSVTTLDPLLAGVMEPRTARPARRLEAIEVLTKADIPVGVLVAPVIPGLTEHELPGIIAAAGKAGAKFAGYTYLLDFGTSGGKISGAAAFGR